MSMITPQIIDTHSSASDTPREREWKYAFQLAKRRHLHFLETPPVLCNCAACLAASRRISHLIEHLPCARCRGIGRGCPDCGGNGWQNGQP
jgi:hypothetical protein